MVDVSDDTEITVALNGYVGDALLEVGLGTECLGIGSGEGREAALKAGADGIGGMGAGVPTAQQAARGPDA